jgi:hypothetical protein
MDVRAGSWLSDEEKELEILPLRQQLRIGGRRQERGPQIPRWQKMPVVATFAIRRRFMPDIDRQSEEETRPLAGLGRWNPHRVCC